MTNVIKPKCPINNLPEKSGCWTGSSVGMTNKKLTAPEGRALDPVSEMESPAPSQERGADFPSDMANTPDNALVAVTATPRKTAVELGGGSLCKEAV